MEWPRTGGWHPVSFKPKSINQAMLQKMRGQSSEDMCNSEAAIASARAALFEPLVLAPRKTSGARSTSDAAGEDDRIVGSAGCAPEAPAAQQAAAVLPAAAVGRNFIGERDFAHPAAAAQLAGLLAAAAAQRSQSQAPGGAAQQLPAATMATDGSAGLQLTTSDGNSGRVSLDAPAGGGGRNELDEWMFSAGYARLGYHCPLFARKFKEEAVEAALAMALSCNGVGLGAWCQQGI